MRVSLERTGVSVEVIPFRTVVSFISRVPVPVYERIVEGGTLD
jgi:hypothetical protein